ncbi:hypothetical protein [Roseiconus lacunae]|uniref:hypothetical protein n=1 Tax=Roseiconus lacunae TaxID=2605694 RepID=UPI001E44E9A5|nr:hypothetical protein [Roseiconus lacunae]MCD0460057.1 hypothetical protein [Roseiconus lacunae]
MRRQRLLLVDRVLAANYDLTDIPESKKTCGGYSNMRTNQVLDGLRYLNELFDVELVRGYPQLTGVALDQLRLNTGEEAANLILAAEKVSKDSTLLEICIALKCESFANPHTIASLLFVPMDDDHHIGDQWNRLRGAIDLIDAWDKLINSAYSTVDASVESVLSIEIRSRNPVSAKQLQTVTAASLALYDAMATLEAVADTELMLVKIESGSFVKLDFKGSDEVVSRVKELLIDCWKVFYSRASTRAIDNSDAIIKSMEAFEKINLAKDEGRITKEQAHLLSKSVSSSVENLLGNKAVLSEIPEKEESDNVAALEHVSQKLLPAPTITVVEDVDESDNDSQKKKGRKRRNTER